MARYSIMTHPWDDEFCRIFHYPSGLPEIHKPAEGERMGSEFPTGLEFQMAAEAPGLRVGDVIDNALGYLMVSGRMKALLERHASVDIEFLRFTLLNHKGRLASDDCYIVNIIGTLDCVDLKKTKGHLDPMEDNKRFMQLRRLFLDERRIPPHANLFRISPMPTVILLRDDLQSILRQSGMTGFALQEVGSWVEINA